MPPNKHLRKKYCVYGVNYPLSTSALLLISVAGNVKLVFSAVKLHSQHQPIITLT